MNPARAACVLALAMACHPVASAAPTFFRAVGSPPDTVFPRGFRPWGTNENLVQHVAGTSCNRPRPGEEDRNGSAYVSLAGTREAVLRVGRTRLTQITQVNPQGTMWVYEIRPTENTYNVPLTLERAGVPLHEGPLRAIYQNALLHDEWVQRGAIGPQVIRGARAYRLVNGEAVEVPGSAVTNPAYVEVETQANPNPLPATVVVGTPTGVAARGRALIGAAAAGLVSACWCERPDDAQARAASAELACGADILVINKVSPTLAHFLQQGWLVDP